MRKTRFASSVILIIALFTILAFPASAVGEMGKFGYFNTVSIGPSHSAAIMAAGDLYTWGHNAYGQLGYTSSTYYTSNIGAEISYTPKPTKVPGLSNVIAVSLGSFHSAAITADGDLYTWGINDSGQLGYSSNSYSAGNNHPYTRTPTKVPGLSNVIAVSLGGFHSAAVTADGSLYLWGDNSYGQLGYSTTEKNANGYPYEQTPTKVSGLSNVVAVCLGSADSMALTSNGDLYVWGNAHASTPTKVTTLSNIVAISSFAAITADGDLFIWDKSYLEAPKKVSEITNAVVVSTGSIKTVVTASGDLFTIGYCSGWNSDGVQWQLGNSEAGEKPWKQPGISDAVTVSVSSNSCAVITAAGDLYAWGYNNSGEVGDGTREYRPSPVKTASGIMLPPQPKPIPEPAEKPSEWAEAEVNAALAAGLVPASVAKSGWQNATSRLAAAESVCLLIEESLGKTIEQIAAEQGWDLSTNHFSDTKDPVVTFLKYAGITTGVDGVRYDPSGDYTRAQIVTMIGRTAEVFFGEVMQGENPFSDVPFWAASYVGYAAENGITQGVGGNLFGSNGVLQNQQTAVFIFRTYNVWQ